jgi:hypothetical protein
MTWRNRSFWGWAVEFSAYRLAARWRAALMVIVGVTLAALIGANIPLYTDAVLQIGMLESIRALPEEDVNIHSWVSVANRQLDPQWAQLDADVQVLARTQLSDPYPNWVTQALNGAEALPLPVENAPQKTRLRLAYYDHWQDRVTLVSGTWPQPPADDAADLEAALPVSAASELNLAAGDVVVLYNAADKGSLPIRVRIAGLILETDPENGYWFSPSPLRLDSSLEWALETNLLTTRDDFLRVVPQAIPDASTWIIWRFVFDYSYLPFQQVSAVIEHFQAFKQQMAAVIGDQGAPAHRLVYQQNVIAPLKDYQDEVRVLRAPFGLVLIQIGTLVLFFLFVIVSLAQRGERREIALMQSRGAFDAHIVILRGVEGLIVCAAAVMAAPWLARGMLVWFVPTLMDTDRLSLAMDGQAFAFAALAAGAALIVLLMSLRPVLRLPLITGGGSTVRSASRLWWQRYYLDVVLMIIGLAALWRLLSSNSVLTVTASGEQRADPLLLIAPSLLFLALGSILLRLFPVIMGLIARAWASRPGLAGVLASWQVSRDPIHYAHITFLLALSIGMGWFATSFQATILASQRDRADYRVGADMRLTEYDTAQETARARPLAAYVETPGVAAAAQAWRQTDVGVTVDGLSFDGGDILAVDHNAIGRVAYWRDDLGPLPHIAGSDLPVTGAALPVIPQRIGFWARLDVSGAEGYVPDLFRLLSAIDLKLRVRDERGTFFYLRCAPVEIEGLDRADVAASVERALTIGRRSFYLYPSPEESTFISALEALSGWVYFEADLQGVRNAQRLDLLSVKYMPYVQDSLEWRLLLTDPDLFGQDGEPVALRVADQWSINADARIAAVATRVSTGETRHGEPLREIAWTMRARQDGHFSVLVNYPALADPIPALVSPAFARLNNLAPGLTFSLPVTGMRQTFIVTDVIRYYPTLYDDIRPYMVADLDTLLYAVNRQEGRVYYPDETWVKLAPGFAAPDMLQRLTLHASATHVTNELTRQQALDDIANAPLALGLIGLLYLSSAGVLVLSVITLLSYAALTAQARQFEFGVLRSLGMPSGHLVMSLAVEQLFVMGTAVVLGGIIGAVLSQRILPALASGITTDSVTPPFLIRTETQTMFQFGVVIAAVLILVLALSLMLMRRLSLSQALRIGEE